MRAALRANSRRRADEVESVLEACLEKLDSYGGDESADDATEQPPVQQTTQTLTPPPVFEPSQSQFPTYNYGSDYFQPNYGGYGQFPGPHYEGQGASTSHQSFQFPTPHFDQGPSTSQQGIYEEGTFLDLFLGTSQNPSQQQPSNQCPPNQSSWFF